MKGWRVVCPDGKERHYPYINHGDAEFDAGYHSQWRDGCRADPEMVQKHGHCPGGLHEALPITFAPTQPAGEA